MVTMTNRKVLQPVEELARREPTRSHPRAHRNPRRDSDPPDLLSPGGGPERNSYTDSSGTWHYVLSRSPAMKNAERRALRVAPSDETVLILGETGVGKDLMARLIHENSARKNGPFVHLNCAALPESLLESELFGHMRGSYTGATENRPGQFEIAAGGTLFLDEIGEMPARLQAKLLHVLQERKIYRIGGRQVVSVDVRVLAATNRDLTQDIRSGAFRRDLYYRLGVVTLQIPPLRERREDLDDLALHYFEKFSTLYNRPDLALPDETILEKLRCARWSGNIRELQNAIKRYMLLGGSEAFEVDEELPSSEAAASEMEPESQNEMATTGPGGGQVVSLKEVSRAAVTRAETHAILQALEQTRWNRKKAALELGISYRSLMYKLKEYGLHKPGVPQDEFA